MQKSKIKNYFPGGNTAQGFYSFYNYLPYNIGEIYIIKGGPGTGKSTFMKDIGHEAVEKGYEIEFHWCSSDNDSLDGVVIPELNTAILDGTAPHIVDPVNPGAVEEIIYVGEYWDSKILNKYRDEIKNLNNIIARKFEKSYNYLKIAKLVHDEWEELYQQGFNYDKANIITDNLIREILPYKEVTTSGTERHLFGSALTPEGPVDYLDNLTEDVSRRYIIKGRPGTGKSTMTKKIAESILQNGYNVIFLHCSFDPESVDSIIIPELETAVIDGTNPHVVEAVRKGDQIVDMLKCVDNRIIDENKTEIAEVKKLYQTVMDKAIKTIKNAKLTHDRLEKYYIEAMDFAKLEERRKKVFTEIMENKIALTL